MLLRIRWFVLGVLSTVGGGAYLLAKLRRVRARLSAANLRKVSAHSLADVLDAAGRAILPGDGPDGNGSRIGGQTAG